ncbi:nucleotidyl transferase AbiEii/AbiGii toxin family protein [Desulfallas sp. Bu1-1]|uniref:nucleotidyl transferase AbiEii/AbiGii toxin family protein n=1 Tax=Desulfallas sp. Bu1-1 TaxID=2787620 RepID=UPI00189F4732|nr:nucleotidyl transferase AbiEii/AbiGii toxin family protein [Desulfallas sp. Bu1-1]MBF7084686.1 nucleotidyl transferase AbiEii/AbiGii toxin family protein [Desulfallas sp. Bu1-1]
MPLDKSRQKALFWRVPDNVLNDSAFATWRAKTILCEGSAADVGELDVQQIEQTLADKFLPPKIRKMWSEFFQSESQRKVPKMRLSPLQKKTLEIFSSVNRDSNFHFTRGTALAICYLQQRESEDLDLFTGDAVSLAPTAQEFESQLQAAGLDVQVVRRQATFVRLLIARKLNVKKFYMEQRIKLLRRINGKPGNN